jgi:hypothetical protein
MPRVVSELPIIFAPSQTFSATLAERRCDFTMNYSEWSDRWSFDLAIDGVDVLHGRRIVVGTDLIAPFNFGIGEIVALDPSGGNAKPGRTELPDGRVRLYHAWDAP